MEFTVHYVMDGIGYSKVYTAKSEVAATEACKEELKELYPLSVIDIGKVEEVEKKKKSKEGKS